MQILGNDHSAVTPLFYLLLATYLVCILLNVVPHLVLLGRALVVRIFSIFTPALSQTHSPFCVMQGLFRRIRHRQGGWCGAPVQEASDGGEEWSEGEDAEDGHEGVMQRSSAAVFQLSSNFF